MRTELLSPSTVTMCRRWELTLDAELLPGAAAVTPDRAEAVARPLAWVPGVGAVAVRPHCGGRFLLVDLTVEARDLTDAVDRAAASLRRCAMDAGLGPLVLVAARHSNCG
ncbi:MAG: hypothetical protein E6J41_12310 [Chloroflexi bacterium]|nr:MAG: hypothetical protein E6J41_12310 [Chloroflexota bacterium]